MLEKPSNALVKYWSKLGLAKYRRAEGAFLAEGVKVVGELLKSPWNAVAVMVLEGREDRWEAFLPIIPRRVPTCLLTESQWRKISQDKEPEGIMAEVVRPEPELAAAFLAKAEGHLLLAHEIGNPQNLGALIRTADWFGIRAIVLSENSVDATHPKAVRASMGSLFHLKIMENANFSTIIPELRPSFRIIGTDAAHGLPPRACAQKMALIVGSESHGLPEGVRTLADECWHITRLGGAESLSLPQAAAVLLYALTREGKER